MQELHNQIFIALGSNIGNRKNYLDSALSELENEVGKILMVSSVYETEPWGVENQSAYLNQVVEIATTLSPEKLLLKLLEIEKKLGRERLAKWSARTIDLDILFYQQLIIKKQDLIIPHPFLQERRFVLEPLTEIAENFLHPILNKSLAELLKNCSDNGMVKKIDFNSTKSMQ